MNTIIIIVCIVISIACLCYASYNTGHLKGLEETRGLIDHLVKQIEIGEKLMQIYRDESEDVKGKK